MTTSIALTAPTAAERPARPKDHGSSLDGQVLGWLRLEGLAALLAGIALYARLGGDWLWFVPALVLVDVSMIGYLRNARLGALTYDLAHNWATGLAVLGLGLGLGVPVVALAGAVLVAHTGVDRSLGYGLKLATGFKDTHLGRLGR